jgi:hypothetical protein
MHGAAALYCRSTNARLLALIPEGPVYYYELHEGDEDLMADVILACEDELSPDEFFELVQEVRRAVQSSYEEDSLIEAIAAELERRHGFVHVSDERLVAAVFVSAREADNILITPDDGDDDDEDDEDDGDDDDEDEDLDDLPDYRTIIADLDAGPRSN